MAIAIENVESPAGELDMAVLFPGDGTATATGAWQDRIAGYIADAEARATAGDLTDEDEADEFAFHWVHYRAFYAKYLAMNADAASGKLPEGGSYQFFESQLAVFKAAFELHLAAANGILLPGNASGWGMASVFRGS